MIRTSAPVGTSKGTIAPPSISDFTEVYGDPAINMRKRTQYEDGVAYMTFEAKDPVQQAALDTWAAQIDADTEGEIRAKINTAAEADEARVARDGGERKIHRMPTLRNEAEIV